MLNENEIVQLIEELVDSTKNQILLEMKVYGYKSKNKPHPTAEIVCGIRTMMGAASIDSLYAVLETPHPKRTRLHEVMCLLNPEKWEAL